jgi:hypothetical protein
MPTPHRFWEDLFAAPEGPGQGIQVEMSLLKKRGQPLLLLPGQARPAAATMDLYPAQTGRARAARMLLRCLLRASLPLGTERVSLAISPQDPFVGFLASLAGRREGELPTLGILAGNPASEGQRFLLLVFNSRQTPVAVVKAGVSQRARALIQQEESFLAAAPAKTMAVPRLRARFESPRLCALAMDFFPGDSPRPRDEAAIPSVLSSWVDPQRTIAVSDTPDWRRLEGAATGRALFAALPAQLSGRKLRPAIHHGDFVPWNIKVSPAGAWTVLDWERGELAGIPGWDWFHYVIQSGILVGHQSAPVLMQRVESLLDSDAFKQYAARAGILGCERELVLAYLLHVVEVIKPSEGLTATAELLKALSARWRNA